MFRVELIGISKSFGGISALEKVTLKVKPGEIHALVGENGAGKSTLMKILSGAYQKDEGKILIDRHEVHIRNTYDSKTLGIGIIYQELSLVPDLSVAENIFLSHLGAGGSWMKWATLKRMAQELINNLGFSIDPLTKVRNLSIAHQQIVEIAKALSEEVKILILDEPSAVLGPHDIQKLFETLKRLRDQGVSIIYISHRLEEIFRIADRISVLKDGVSGEGLEIRNTNQDEIIKQMLGRSLDTLFPERKPSEGKEILKVEGIRSKKMVKEVTLTVRTGEILGIAGLVGSGRTEIARAIFGADRKVNGIVFIDGKVSNIRSPAEAVNAGVGMVPEDRKQQGVILSCTIKENISLTNLDKVTFRTGFFKREKENRITEDLIRKLLIKTKDKNLEAGTLSGGNQQKIALAKWINRECRILIIDEPTRGVDIGAKVEIYKLIDELSKQGVAILVISSETMELIGICDRILVIRNGEIRGELEKKDFSDERILRLAIGV